MRSHTSSVVVSAVLLALFVTGTLANNGVDISQPASVSTFQCMKNNGKSFVIVRGYCSYGGIDTNAKQTLENAKSAGLYHDAYHFPCMGKVSAQAQVDQIYNYLGTLPGGYWIDIETNPSPGCGWQGASANCQFLGELVTAFKGKGVNVGIYASSYMWSTIFGSVNNCKNFANLQLWYAHYDGTANFNDFTPFGGWTKPAIKQYAGTTTFCGMGVDLDWYP